MTNPFSTVKKSINISIHTPARGVTVPQLGQDAAWSISIHTPARGVTFYTKAEWHRFEISIHTPARGVTQHTLTLSICLIFQSTLPQGE